MTEVLVYVGAAYAAFAAVVTLFLYFGGDHKGVKALILAPAFGAVWPFFLWITARETYRTRKEAEQKERERAAWERHNRRLQEKGLLTDDGRYVKVWMFFGDDASDVGDYVSVLREWSIDNQTVRTESWRCRVLTVEREFTTRNELYKFRLDVGDRLVAIYAPGGSLVFHGSWLTDRSSYEDWEVLSFKNDSRLTRIPPGVLREIDAAAGPSWRRYAEQSWTDAVTQSQA